MRFRQATRDWVHMRAEDLFVQTVEDLRRRCALRASEYDAVRAAGLIRQLVMDTHPLAYAVIKARGEDRIKVGWSVQRFQVHDRILVCGFYLDPELLRVTGQDACCYAAGRVS